MPQTGSFIRCSQVYFKGLFQILGRQTDICFGHIALIFTKQNPAHRHDNGQKYNQKQLSFHKTTLFFKKLGGYIKNQFRITANAFLIKEFSRVPIHLDILPGRIIIKAIIIFHVLRIYRMTNFFFDLTQNNPNCFFLIAGPCVIEDLDTSLGIAKYLKQVTSDLGIPYIFKASYDKANRTSIQSFRGPGPERGLEILKQVKTELDIPVISDIHLPDQAEKASKVLDIIQIPAFLCRQTDLILAACRTGKPVNIKKGQFLAPADCQNIVEKAKSTGNHNIAITERGTCFGYNNLVVDFRSIQILRESGIPVIFDATHSVQLPGGSGNASAGERQFVAPLARAAVACGAHGLFMETHPDPDKALCDGPNSIPLDQMKTLLTHLVKIRNVAGQAL